MTGPCIKHRSLYQAQILVSSTGPCIKHRSLYQAQVLVSSTGPYIKHVTNAMQPKWQSIFINIIRIDSDIKSRKTTNNFFN
jgi:hypothetical protein